MTYKIGIFVNVCRGIKSKSGPDEEWKFKQSKPLHTVVV